MPPVTDPTMTVRVREVRRLLSRAKVQHSNTERIIEQYTGWLKNWKEATNPFDEEEEDDPTQVRYPPRSRAATSTRTLLSTSAAFADPLEQDLPDDTPSALVERAQRNVEKLTQHRSNLMVEQQKTDELIGQWMHIAHALDDLATNLFDEDSED